MSIGRLKVVLSLVFFVPIGVHLALGDAVLETQLAIVPGAELVDIPVEGFEELRQDNYYREHAKDSDGPVVGISIGATHSCMGIYRNGQVQIIPNEDGSHLTPTVYAFNRADVSADEITVGEAAKQQLATDAPQTIFGIKHVIGRRYDRQAANRMPYLINDDKGTQMINVTILGKQRSYTLVEVLSMLVSRMMRSAAIYLGREVKHAVITVPASFGDQQRQAMKDVGVGAGLNVLRIISAPTAAAIAYGLDKHTEKNIVVYHLGGESFEASLQTIDNGVFEIVATKGDKYLGGEAFDQRIVDHLTHVFSQRHGQNISHGTQALHKLRIEAKKAKHALTRENETQIYIENVIDGITFSYVLTRSLFEELNQDLFNQTLSYVQSLLESSGVSSSQIDHVVFAGGATRMPKVQQMVRELFDSQTVFNDDRIPPDEVVAYGASIQAGSLSSIGKFEACVETVGGELLAGKSATDDKDARLIRDALGGELNSSFWSSGRLQLVGELERETLIQFLDRKHRGERDIKLHLSKDQLSQLIGKHALDNLQRFFVAGIDEFILRRTEANKQCIPFHKDIPRQVLQVPLNSPDEYVGGRIAYLTETGFEFPARIAGSATIHDDSVIHGVTQLESGTRYSLFAVRSQHKGIPVSLRGSQQVESSSSH